MKIQCSRYQKPFSYLQKLLAKQMKNPRKPAKTFQVSEMYGNAFEIIGLICSSRFSKMQIAKEFLIQKRFRKTKKPTYCAVYD